MLRGLICPFSKGKKNCLSRRLSWRKRLEGVGVCGEEAGGSQLREMKGRFFLGGAFFWRVTVQQRESILGNVGWWWCVCGRKSGSPQY